MDERTLAELKSSRELLLDLSSEFFTEAADITDSVERSREIESLRRRAAMRLVPVMKMGFEHVYADPSSSR